MRNNRSNSRRPRADFQTSAEPRRFPFIFDPTRREQRDTISEIGVDHRGTTWLGFKDSAEIVYLPEDDTYNRTVSRLKGLGVHLVELSPAQPNEHCWSINPAYINYAWEHAGKATLRTAEGFGELATAHSLEELAEKIGKKRFMIFETYPLRTQNEHPPADKVMIDKTTIRGWSLLGYNACSLQIINPDTGQTSYIAVKNADAGLMGDRYGRPQRPINGYAIDIAPQP